MERVTLNTRTITRLFLSLTVFSAVAFANDSHKTGKSTEADKASQLERDQIVLNAAQMVTQGREIFRFDTFGDEQFWSDALQLHKAIEGERFGGIGKGLTPQQALDLGLKFDVEALPDSVVQQLEQGAVELNDVAVMLALIKQDAVLGVKGTFNEDGSLKSVGFTCALCHSTVNDSLAPGVGERLDGWANRDLNVGAIIAFAPNLQPIVDLLRIVHSNITDSEVRDVLRSWGPGKFDAELLLDGKAFTPEGNPAATLIPNAFGLSGYNQHTWTGDWGTVIYWNAFVAVLELRGVGTFFDPRLDDADKFPIAAAEKFGHIFVDPKEDQVTPKLPALHVYQLALSAPKPKAGVDFDAGAAERGSELFRDKAKCGSCHVEPLWTEPGWNQHTPEEMKIDAFQANRAPGNAYKTMNLAGIFVRERGLFMRPENKGRFYHDGRFKTLLDVVDSYNERFDLGLSDREKRDLVEYLKSL